MTMVEAVKGIWGKLKRKDQVRFAITTVIGISWPVYAAADQPLGELLSPIQTGLWVLFGMVAVRLVIFAVLVVSIHSAAKKAGV